MLFTCIGLFVLKKTLSFQIEGDFLEIAKLNSQQEKTVSWVIAKVSSRKTKKIANLQN